MRTPASLAIQMAAACWRIDLSAAFVPNGPGSNQGWLLFVREQTLMAQAFDAASLQLSGATRLWWRTRCSPRV